MLLILILSMWLTMLLGTGPVIVQEAGGHALLDSRLTGYRADEARDFLEAISQTGREIYLYAHRPMGTLLALLSTVMLVWSFRTMLPAGRIGHGAVIMALAATGADLVENARIANMMRLPPIEVSDSQIGFASAVTSLKWLLLGLCLALLFALFALLVNIWMKQRQQ